MALLTGPLHSDAASGSIKGGVTYSRWKGRAYARATVTPANPRSASQTGNRAMFGFLASMWAGLSAAAKASWAALASVTNISAFNAYAAENLKRWQLFQPPTQEYPAAEASTGLTVSAHTYTGGTGFATLSLTPSGATNIWGFAIFRDTAEIVSPNWNNCIAVIEADGANAVSYTDSPLPAGTYHYRAAVINIDGKMGTILADATAVVT